MSWSWSSMQRHRREPLPNRRWSGASRRSPSNAGSRSWEPAGLPPALSQPTGHALERDVAARPKSPPLSPLRPGSATRARRCRSTAARGCSSGRLRCRSVRRPTTCPMPEGRDATALRLTPPPYVGVGTCPHIGLSTARSSSCQDHNPRTTTTVVAVANRSGRAAWRRRERRSRSRQDPARCRGAGSASDATFLRSGAGSTSWCSPSRRCIHSPCIGAWRRSHAAEEDAGGLEFGTGFQPATFQKRVSASVPGVLPE